MFYWDRVHCSMLWTVMHGRFVESTVSGSWIVASLQRRSHLCGQDPPCAARPQAAQSYQQGQGTQGKIVLKSYISYTFFPLRWKLLTQFGKPTVGQTYGCPFSSLHFYLDIGHATSPIKLLLSLALIVIFLYISASRSVRDCGDQDHR